MDARYHLLGISGSLRTGSFSTAVLMSLAEMRVSAADLEYASIGDLPHFNQDLYVVPLPKAVEQFRGQISAADGLVIPSPEYNHGIPGVLKNAMDWASRPHNRSPLRGKPAIIVTSSPPFTGGVRAQHQIREALISALARPVNTPEIVVGEVGQKITRGHFDNAATLQMARDAFTTMFEEIARPASR